MKLGTFFILQEFVPKEIYDQFGDNSIWFIDKDIVLLADFIRSRFGKPMTINNWHSGGQFNNRGFRMPNCATGGFLSQHKLKNAIDFNIEGKTPQEVYKDIMDNQDMYLKAGATTVEDIEYTNGWNHIDKRYTGLNHMLIVKP